MNVKDFIDAYLDSVIYVLGGKKQMAAEDFYSMLWGRVREKTGFTDEKIKYLHHSFHWALFCYDSSPMRYKSGMNNASYVVAVTPPDKSQLVKMLDKNLELLSLRFNQNNFHQEP